jgi:hypothetical protein
VQIGLSTFNLYLNAESIEDNKTYFILHALEHQVKVNRCICALGSCISIRPQALNFIMPQAVRIFPYTFCPGHQEFLSSGEVKGTVLRDGYFFEGLNIVISTFYV